MTYLEQSNAQEELVLQSQLKNSKLNDEDLAHKSSSISLEQILSDNEKNLFRDSLAEYIGPMAIFASSEVLKKTAKVEDAITIMASKIPNHDDARAFESLLRLNFQINRPAS